MCAFSYSVTLWPWPLHPKIYTADLQLIICIIAKYEKDLMKMADKSQNAVGGKEKKNIWKKKENTTQQQKGLPTFKVVKITFYW